MDGDGCEKTRAGEDRRTLEQMADFGDDGNLELFADPEQRRGDVDRGAHRLLDLFGLVECGVGLLHHALGLVLEGATAPLFRTCRVACDRSVVVGKSEGL